MYNVTFDNITMLDTSNGPRIKSQRGRGGVVADIVYKNIKAGHVADMISVTLEYHTGIPPTNKTATPVFRNFLFENITFSGSDNGGVFLGLPESPIVNVTLRNVNFNKYGFFMLRRCVYQAFINIFGLSFGISLIAAA